MGFSIIRKSARGVDLIPEDTYYLEKRIILLDGEINTVTSFEFTKKIGVLLSEDDKRDINILINSPGGEIVSGLSIINEIENSGVNINAYCSVNCSSMGAIIFSSVPGVRLMSPSARLMFHEPLIQRNAPSPLSQVQEDAKSLSDKKSQLAKILAKRCKKTEKEIKGILGKDKYFSAEEALSFGLCDKLGGIKDVFNI